MPGLIFRFQTRLISSGSKRRTGTVLRHLEEEGFPREALDAVHTPIGLDIGAETPEEIAVAIVAELVQTRARRRAKK